MRIGQYVKWKSLHTGNWCDGIVRCFEHGPDGYVLVDIPGVDGRSGVTHIPVRKSRIVIPQPNAKFSAKDGGDDPDSTPAIMPEAT